MRESLHAEVSRDVVTGRGRDRDDPSEATGDAGLHPDEAVPPAQRQPPAEVVGVAQIELAVDGDRMVDRRDERPTVAHHPEQAGAERLIVVDEVEVRPPAGEQSPRPQAERERLGEAGRAHDGELGGVDEGMELVRPRHPERVRFPVEVEARHRNETHPLVEHRVGLPGEHRDVMAEGGELAGEVAGVDTLPATTGVAPVDEICDAKGHPINRHDRASLSRIAAGTQAAPATLTAA